MECLVILKTPRVEQDHIVVEGVEDWYIEQEIDQSVNYAKNMDTHWLTDGTCMIL